MLTRTRSSTRIAATKRISAKRKNSDDEENTNRQADPSLIAKRRATTLKNNSENNNANSMVGTITKDLRKKAQINTNEKENPTANTTTSSTTVFQRAKAIFRRTAIPTRLIGREEERQRMLAFWKAHVLDNRAGGLYISGMPGTGKTAMLNEIMRNQETTLASLETHTAKLALVNCMTITDPKMVYPTLLELFNIPIKSSTSCVQLAEEYFTGSNVANKNIKKKKQQLYVVVLDEIDSLITKDQQVLYKLFEWSHLPQSRLVLIGIANALDLTDRILPRLRAKNCEPELLNFNPYQIDEITSIIRDRLNTYAKEEDELYANKQKQLTAPRQRLVFQEKAIEICARKVAAAMGDLRIALDVCRQAIELVEWEQKRKVLGECNGTKSTSILLAKNGISMINSQNAATPTTDSLPSIVNVTVVHILKVLSNVFNGTQQKLKQLNLQHQVVLGVMLLMMRTASKSSDKDQFTLTAFHEMYTKLCRHTEAKIPTVSRTELNDVLSLLESYSIIRISGKDEKTRKLHLNVQESEIIETINTKPILKTWMQEALVQSGL